MRFPYLNTSVYEIKLFWWRCPLRHNMTPFMISQFHYFAISPFHTIRLTLISQPFDIWWGSLRFLQNNWWIFDIAATFHDFRLSRFHYFVISWFYTITLTLISQPFGVQSAIYIIVDKFVMWPDTFHNLTISWFHSFTQSY